MSEHRPMFVDLDWDEPRISGRWKRYVEDDSWVENLRCRGGGEGLDGDDGETGRE